jgi:hypothetical protein
MAITKVWALDDSTRLRKTDLGSNLSLSNPSWNGHSVNLFGAKDEIIAFQIICENSTINKSGQLTISLDSLTSANGINVIRNTSTDPTSYQGRYIEIFKENYFNVRRRLDYAVTPDSGQANLGAKLLPDSDWLGWWPDQLIPVESTKNEATASANNIQGFWIDIYIPRTAISSSYFGNVTVKEAGVTVATLPVTMSVFNVKMPSTRSCHLAMYMGNGPDRHPGCETKFTTVWWNMIKKYQQLFHRHGIDCYMSSMTTNEASGVGSSTTGLIPYLNGSGFTEANGYYGPWQNNGFFMYYIGQYDQGNSQGEPNASGWRSGFWPDDASGFHAGATAWKTFFAVNAPNVIYAKYLLDEPGHDRVYNQVVINKSNWCHNDGLKTVVSATWADVLLYDSVDIWNLSNYCGTEQTPWNGYITSVNNAIDPWKTAEQLRKSGKYVGSYMGYPPACPFPEPFDVPLTDNRALGWLMKRYNVDHYWSFESTVWTDHTINNVGGGMPVDPFVETYNDMSGDYQQGRGSYVFPGQDVLYPNNNFLAFPISCIRMKVIRRGLQDYELARLAELSGSLGNEVTTIVPHGYGETNQTGPRPWPISASFYENARLSLLKKLDSAEKPPIPPQPVLPSGIFYTIPTSSVGTVTTTLTWKADNASSASIDNGIGVVSPISGSISVLVSASTTYTLSLTNSVGVTKYTTNVQINPSPMPPIPPTPPPVNVMTGSISVSPTQLIGSGTVTVNWTAQNAGAMYMNAPTVASGSATFFVSGTRAYVLTLTPVDGGDMQQYSAVVTVTSPLPPPINIIRNGTFETSTDWNFYSDTSQCKYTYAVPGYISNRCANISLGTTVGTNVQLYEYNIPLKARVAYKLEFWVKSSTNNKMGVSLGQHVSPYVNYGVNQTVSTTTAWQKISIQFTSSNTSDITDGRLRFYFNGISSINSTINIDDVWLYLV